MQEIQYMLSKISKLISFIQKCKHIWLQSITLHVFIAKLALLKQLDKESSSHAEHPCVFSLWGLKLEQTWPSLLLSEADMLLWFVAGIAPSRSEPLITTPRPRSSAQVITRSACRWIIWDLLVLCRSTHAQVPGLERKNRCRVCWTITGLIPPPSGHHGYYSCTRNRVLQIGAVFFFSK